MSSTIRRAKEGAGLANHPRDGVGRCRAIQQIGTDPAALRYPRPESGLTHDQSLIAHVPGYLLAVRHRGKVNSAWFEEFASSCVWAGESGTSRRSGRTHSKVSAR